MKIGYLIGILLSVILLHGAECQQVSYKPVEAAEIYQAPNCAFSALVPSGWYRSDMANDQRKKGIGVVIIGPSDSNGIEVKMSFGYYQNGEAYRNGTEYIIIQLDEYEIIRKPPFKKVSLAGKIGKSFAFITTERVIKPGWRMPSMESGIDYVVEPPMNSVSVHHQYVVLSGKKGFYVFYYEAPEDMYLKHKDTFMKILNSLRFMNPEPWQEKVK